MEYNTYITEATEEGYNKGHEKGYNEGHEQGIEQGIKQGIKQNNIDVAKKMLDKKLDITTIEEITGLTKEEIMKLK